MRCSVSAGLCLASSVGVVASGVVASGITTSADNSTFCNPILPGFHPDPSCIYLPEHDGTFFCASSSFNAFPGIPIHASRDLQNWRLIGHVLTRREQLPELAETNRSTSGIWAPTIRYHEGTFWVLTTLVNDELPQEDASRWNNIIFKSEDPFEPDSWSDAVHFNFTGYDTSPFWDDDGKTYITGAHAWHVGPYIQQAEADLETGEVGEWQILWNGTGGMAPEGPHIYRKDGYYYLLVAEGGTGLDHMVTMARSKDLAGPYEANPANPVLTNANTTNYFQTVGHADLFQDADGNWWSVALSTRSGPEYLHYPMGRETVMAPVTWPEGDWPYFSQVRGEMDGWKLPLEDKEIGGIGPFITDGDHVDFPPGSSLPAHFTYWRFPISESFAVSPPGHPNTLRVAPSALNLTALDGNYAGPSGQSFVGRRQQDTLFSYSVVLDFDPSAEDEEAGVSVFLTQNHHLDIGLVLLPAASSTADLFLSASSSPSSSRKLMPQIRFRGISSAPVPDPIVAPLPDAWVSRPLQLEIKAPNATHYTFSVGLAAADNNKEDVFPLELYKILDVSNEAVSWGFTGTIVGVYCTTNGGQGSTEAYFSNWTYVSQGQIRG